MLIEYKSSNPDIVFCFLDNTHLYQSAWSEELIKNQADNNITNITNKGYTILQGQNEDELLKKSYEMGFALAVVFSTGTEFINGTSFMKSVESVLKEDFFIAGHVLDRGNAYYELHHQCYIVNLKQYRDVGLPDVGQQCLGRKHQQIKPLRSLENIHDDYTPLWIKSGSDIATYDHCCHGWNIIKIALEKDLNIKVFDDSFRNNKKHFYPENQQDFLNHLSWAYKRLHFCSDEFVHYSNSETPNQHLENIHQVVTPASGTWWKDIISKVEPVTVVLYDYNQSALNYWKNSVPSYGNVTYHFQKVNLLTDTFDLSMLDSEKSTLVNLSNIFAYEGTAFFYSLEYRLTRENQVIDIISQEFPNAIINFTGRAADGFAESKRFFRASEKNKISLNDCKKPTWHWRDWL